MIPAPTDQLTRFVRERLAKLGLSQTEMCRRAGISRQTLHALSSATGKLPALQTVIAVAGALRVHPIRLLQIICDEQIAATPAVRLTSQPNDMSAFVCDGDVPDGTLVLPGQRFCKVWTLQNVGAVAWTDRWLQCQDEELVVYSNAGEVLRLAQNLTPITRCVPVPHTRPGETVEISVDFEAPSAPGAVMSYWKMTDADGNLSFPAARGLWVKVQVTSLGAAEHPARP